MNATIRDSLRAIGLRVKCLWVKKKSAVKNVTTLCVKKSVGGKSLDQ